MRILPGVGFERNDFLGNEAARSFLQVELGRGEAEFHGDAPSFSVKFKDGRIEDNAAHGADAGAGFES
ncbi:hypothetical protein VCH24_26650 [Variovorax boronicumulans]|nr:hypothetical protein VCH24_26650 [Variovorax boronicumulans]